MIIVFLKRMLTVFLARVSPLSSVAKPRCMMNTRPPAMSTQRLSTRNLTSDGRGSAFSSAKITGEHSTANASAETPSQANREAHVARVAPPERRRESIRSRIPYLFLRSLVVRGFGPRPRTRRRLPSAGAYQETSAVIDNDFLIPEPRKIGSAKSLGSDCLAASLSSADSHDVF